jgi:hypothetical protein
MNSLAEYKVTPLQMAQFWIEQGYKVYNILGACLTAQGFVDSAEMQNVWDYVAIPAENVELQHKIASVLSGPPDWHRVSVHLDNADHHTKMAEGVPSIVGFRGIKGWVVKRLAKISIHVNKVVSRQQNGCSQSLVYSTRALLKILRDHSHESACQTARLSELTSQVAEMRQQLMQQEQVVSRQATLLEQAAGQLAQLTQSGAKESAAARQGMLDRAA